MTAIQVENTWQDVTQIEPDDYVIAGPNQGINIQLGQLAGRDEFLKNLIEVTKQQIFSELAKQGNLNKILCPPGIVTHYGGKNPPEGWLVCDGSKLKKSLYPELYAAIGDIYGADETSFNLPEARYEFIRGAGPTLVVGTKQGDAIRNITGASQFSTGPGDGFLANYGAVGAIGAYGSLGTGYAIKRDSIEIYRGPIGLNFDASRVVPTADENRPRSLVLLAIIKY